MAPLNVNRVPIDSIGTDLSLFKQTLFLLLFFSEYDIKSALFNPPDIMIHVNFIMSIYNTFRYRVHTETIMVKRR